METEEEEYSSVMEQLEQQQGVSAYDALQQVAPEKITNKYFMFRTAFDV